MTLPKTCQNYKTWPCQTDLQWVLIREQECEASEDLQCLWAWWVFQKSICTPWERGDPWQRMAFSMGPPSQKGCQWRIAPGCVGCTEQNAFFLPPWPTHPVSFFSPFLGRTWRVPPTPSSHPQVQGGGPGTAELLCFVPFVLCSDHPEMLEEHWDAQKMPLNTCKVLQLCKRGKQGSRLWLPGGTKPRMLSYCCLLFQVKTILERDASCAGTTWRYL